MQRTWSQGWVYWEQCESEQNQISLLPWLLESQQLTSGLQKTISVVFWHFGNGFTRVIIIQAFDRGLIFTYGLLMHTTQKMNFLLSQSPAYCSRKLCLALCCFFWCTLHVIFLVLELGLQISRVTGWQHNLDQMILKVFTNLNDSMNYFKMVWRVI